MNEWFSKTFGSIKEKWGKWSVVQKIILIALVLLVIGGIVLMMKVSSKPQRVNIFNSPVTDEMQRDRIVTRLDGANVRSYVSEDGIISVDDEKTAKKWRAQLLSEGFEPRDKDPYSIFNDKSFTRNAFDDKVKWKNHIEQQLKNMLERLDGVRQANVILNLPEESLFAADQNPTSASVVISAVPGSDILESKSKVRGIQNVILRAVEGLTDENVTIMNGDTGNQINDFAGMEDADKLTIIQRQQKENLKRESELQSKILKSLQAVVGEKRVRVASASIEMDYSEETVTSKEYTGITIKEDNPNTVYDDSEIVHSLVLSEEVVDKKFTGTGYNPEGPAGVDGQNPPVYSDMSNVIGQSTENGAKRNYALNEKLSTKTVAPKPGRRTVSVMIDGTWNYPLYDEDGKIRLESNGGFVREYVPISDEVLEGYAKAVRAAVGYDALRGDMVEVINAQFDRTDEFKAEDEAFIKSQQTKKTIQISLIALAAVLVAFIIFRIVSKEIERRRRLREEELLRKQQAEREQALWDARNEGMEVTMSVEERKRAELQENATALAKEHPEDVAMLIRTWLREEA